MKSALIAACVAAVVSAGSAVAATKLIDGHSIKNHTIPAMKLTKAAIASLQGMRGLRGHTGATGATGATGPQGPSGTNATSTTFTLVRGPNVDLSPGTAGVSTALCPDGSGAIGGGFIITSNTGPGNVFGLAPDTANGTTVDGWGAVIGNPNTGTLTFHAWGTCTNQTILLPG